MENPTFFHLLTYLYIGFTKLSNNDVSLDHEMAIKRKIAQWMDLSFRNVDQYEMVMRETLEWFNSVQEERQEQEDQEKFFFEIANVLTKNENVDQFMLTRILSEIRDIAVANGKFQQEEKVLHDKLAASMGINISTIDDHCGPLKEIPKQKEKKSTKKKKDSEYKDGSIGFKYGLKKGKNTKGE